MLQPEKVPYRHFAYIFSLYDGKGTEYFSIGQWNNSLQILGSRSINKVKIESIPEIGLGNALPDGEVQFITLSSDSEGTAIYMNGKLAKFFPKFSLISENQLTNGQFILGNSSNGRNPWTGNIFGLAIYNRLLREDEVFRHYQAWVKHGSPSLSENESFAQLYLFDEHNGTLVHNHAGQQHDLLIPPSFHVLYKTILKLPWRQFRLSVSYFTDLIVNVAGCT